MFNLVLLITLFLFLPQDALGLKFNFTISEVRQCAPITINFSSDVGDKNIPIMLTILPLTSTPVLIPIPGVASNTSGVAVTFLPLRAGEEFIASLDDADGRSISKVSDLTRVLPSLNGNSSCIEASRTSLIASDNFELTTTPTQCEEVSVKYNTAVVQSAPSVRVFQPKGKSFYLKQTSDDPTNGNASYLMNVTHGNQVLIMFDDRRQFRRTTNLLTVAGDTSSSVDCLSVAAAVVPSAIPTALDNPENNQKPAAISQAVIIGCSAGGGIIVVIAIAMLIFVFRDRKRRKRRTITSFFSQRQDSNKNAATKTPFEESPLAEAGNPENSGGFVTNPPYVMRELNTSEGKVSLARDSFSSWSHGEGAPSNRSPPRTPSPDQLAIQSLDIEGMLNMATPLSGGYIIGQAMGSETNLPEIDHSHEVQSTLAPEGSRIRHWHAPSDVPADPTVSGTFSGYSVIMPNPFTDENNIVIPSPLIQGPDEPARPASDLVRPISFEQTSADGANLKDEGAVSGREGKRPYDQGSREET